MTEELYSAYHHHRHGHDIFLFRFRPTPECKEPTDEMVVQQLEIDFEEDCDEWLEIDWIADPARWLLVDASIPVKATEESDVLQCLECGRLLGTYHDPGCGKRVIGCPEVVRDDCLDDEEEPE